MSYDIYLNDPDTGEVIEFDKPHNLRGGNYAIGERQAWLNVTYNYAEHFYRTLGEKGIRTLYGMTGEDSIKLLSGAIDALEDNVHPDYWAATEGNARQALINLRVMAVARPDGIWSGD